MGPRATKFPPWQWLLDRIDAAKIKRIEFIQGPASKGVQNRDKQR